MTKIGFAGSAETLSRLGELFSLQHDLTLAPYAEDTAETFAAVIVEEELLGHALLAQGYAHPWFFLAAAGKKPSDFPHFPEENIFVKPLRFENLLIRLRTNLCRFETSEQAALDLGEGLMYTPLSRELTKNGLSLRLTEKEGAIITLLFWRQRTPVSRAELLETVWGYRDGIDTHTLETHIYRLRQKISTAFGLERVKAKDGGYTLF